MVNADFSIHAVNPAAAGPAPAAAAVHGEGGISFDDLIDIVNPLQHIPIVSTLYRAFTGDTIKTFPKVAGDTLFGGMMGFASSMADLVFEKVTGHNFGDTVLALVEDVFSPDSDAPPTAVAANVPEVTVTPMVANAPFEATASSVASNVPALPASVAPASLIMVPGQDALLLALTRNGVANDVAMRAAEAYRRSVGVANTAAATALQGPAN